MEEFKKITENNFEDFQNDDEDYKDWLVEKVYNIFVPTMMDYKYSLEQCLIGCESPIEQLLAIQLERIGLLYIHNYNPFIDVIAINKQEEIETNGEKYRVDFLIPVVYANQIGVKFVIECDGYEFHQKTKEQVEKDNKRQRDLQKSGYEVIRFSGTEIYHKSYQCALEIKNIILSKCKYKKK